MAASPPAVLVDANLLLWAHHRQFEQHEPARQWWSDTMATCAVVGIPWPTIVAFVRISTHPGALERPVPARDALAVVREWLERPNVTTPVPTEAHVGLFDDLVRSGKATGNHIPDAHLAALALEWGLALVSADRDFARYPGVRWHDPTHEW